MSGPFIFIATNRLKEGKLEDERERVPGLVEFIQENEPRLLAFNEYANQEGIAPRGLDSCYRRRPRHAIDGSDRERRAEHFCSSCRAGRALAPAERLPAAARRQHRSPPSR